MGFDVTFHPIGADQLRHFLFDVLDDGSLAAARAAELSAEPKHRKVLDQLYESFPEWLAGRGDPPVGNSFAVVAAVIAGFLHPYWYARGTALTFLAEEHLPEIKSLFVPLGRLGPGPLAALPDESRGMIYGNESASGFIPPQKIARAQELLESLGDRPGRAGLSLLETAVDEEGVESLQAALLYCRERGLGMVEAADVVVPIADHCVTNFENMRAPFLDKMEP